MSAQTDRYRSTRYSRDSAASAHMSAPSQTDPSSFHGSDGRLATHRLDEVAELDARDVLDQAEQVRAGGVSGRRASYSDTPSSERSRPSRPCCR